MGKSKGMTLIELLIAMGLSVLIMAATFIIVNYSASTYDNTAKMVQGNNNTFDAVNVINRYIRSSYFCALSDDGKGIFVTVDDEEFGGTSGAKHVIRIAYDSDDEILFIDRMDGTPTMNVSEGISEMEWTIVGNGVKYMAYETNARGTKVVLFSGYANKRGR